VVLTFAVGTASFTSGAALLLAAHGGPAAGVTVQCAVPRAILFAVVGSLIVLLSQAQRRQRELLARQALTLEQLTISRERNRLARELHDTLAHTLSALSVQLAALNASWEVDQAGARQRAQQAYDLTRTGLDEVRRALHALRASPVEALGLALALNRLATEAAARADLSLTFTVPATLPAIPFAVEQQCYRIVEEALNNVVRHAHAQHLRMACHQEGQGLTFVVADDGQGFAALAEPAAEHFGIMGMRERALLIGATLALHSRPHHGTTVQLTWPGERTPQ
ncbi:MAG: sensor histidine kinase, partial [Ktedonobacterales bacterium]|nr:sensor histidine kinase [Ktedonobacterales bacterium]